MDDVPSEATYSVRISSGQFFTFIEGSHNVYSPSRMQLFGLSLTCVKIGPFRYKAT